jgi:hypothetical protein
MVKNCPFCNSNNLKRPERNSLVLWVECVDCFTQGPMYSVPFPNNTQFEINEAIAIDLWDKRLFDPSL